MNKLLMLAAVVLFAGCGPQSVTKTMSAENSSGQDGTVTLTDKGSAGVEVVIAITANAAEPGQPQLAHIHSGRCPQVGAVTSPLTNVVDGHSTTTVSGVTLAQLQDGNHAVNVHLASAPGTYVSCADL
jgi:hypothetical protein